MLAYRRLSSPLHATRATVGAAWAAALAVAALASDHPLELLALALALGGAVWAAGVAGRLVRPGLALVMAVPVVAINVLVSRHGLTVFARLGDLGPFGQGDLTVEALVYGAVVASKIVLLTLVACLATLCVDPDELLLALRRVSFRSALTASLATRMAWVLAADTRRLAEAQRTRPGGAARGARARLALLSAVVSSSLERALDVAATLELRGVACAACPPRARRPLSRHDLAFAASAAAALALIGLGWLTGATAFQPYPLVRLAAGPATFALCGALVAVLLLPFCDRLGIEP